MTSRYVAFDTGWVPLSRDAVDAMPDDGLEQSIEQILIDRLADVGEKDERFTRLSRGLRMMWATFLVDAEVNNGGFNQFFWNSGGFATDAIDGFRMIGCADHARLVEEAAEMFTAAVDELRPLFQAHTLAAFIESYRRVDVTMLDARYVELPSASSSRVSYIRGHPREFVLP